MLDAMADYRSEPTSPVMTWPNTQCSLDDGSSAAAFLFANHPSLHEDIIFQALEQADGDTATATAWCSLIEKADGALRLLSETFPTVPSDTIKSTLNKLNNDLSKAYCSIANSFPSSWNHPISDSWLRINALPDRLAPSAKAKKFEPDFLHSNPRYADYESRWWDSTIASTQF
jgi:hypothetical protein